MSVNDPTIEKILQANLPASRDDNKELQKRLLKGDVSAREEMINRNVVLVVYKVDRYLLEFPDFEFLRDEMISEGILGLTVAVNRLAMDDNPDGSNNPTGYMSMLIFQAIGEVVDSEAANGSSARTMRRMRKKGVAVLHTVVDGKVLDGKASEYNAERMIELNDLLASCCETDYDRGIIDLREKGYSDREIGIELNLPTTTAYMMRRELYERFLEKSGLPGEV